MHELAPLEQTTCTHARACEPLEQMTSCTHARDCTPLEQAMSVHARACTPLEQTMSACTHARACTPLELTIACRACTPVCMDLGTTHMRACSTSCLDSTRNRVQDLAKEPVADTSTVAWHGVGLNCCMHVIASPQRVLVPASIPPLAMRGWAQGPGAWGREGGCTGQQGEGSGRGREAQAAGNTGLWQRSFRFTTHRRFGP